ncbi:MAG: hypothetical protein AUH43_23855 [Acidobacteria bacterium 13_1_40CM_65_14]|nr:MAG: hypothetical protein AUH43_23855 [Acidobacteria bacterium 13_1_40CM_65_14]
MRIARDVRVKRELRFWDRQETGTGQCQDDAVPTDASAYWYRVTRVSRDELVMQDEVPRFARQTRLRDLLVQKAPL